MIQVVRNDELYHYGKGHDDNPPGRGSGRWAWGTNKEGKKVSKENVRDGLSGASDATKAARKVTKTAKQMKNAQKDAKVAADADSLDLSNMSNAELQEYINRQNLENNYRTLYEKEQRRQQGQDWVDKFLDHADEILGVASGALTVAVLISKIPWLAAKVAP